MYASLTNTEDQIEKLKQKSLIFHLSIMVQKYNPYLTQLHPALTDPR